MKKLTLIVIGITLGFGNLFAQTELKLIANAAAAGDNFGESVFISGGVSILSFREFLVVLQTSRRTNQAAEENSLVRPPYIMEEEDLK